MERHLREKLKRPFPKAVVALGNFDGMHLGHQYIISKTIELAKRTGGTSVIYTFDPHPVKILAPESCPPLIQTLDQRLALIEKMQIDACVVEKFTHEFAKKSPAEFFAEILVKQIGAVTIIVGYDFTFGYHRGGTVELLEELGKKHAIEVLVIEAKFLGDLLLSSTEIRHLISTGNVKEARTMLGRPFRIEGEVVKGKGLGGYLGAHTANIKTPNELLPGNGIYMTLTEIAGGTRPSVTSIGTNPTFRGEPLSVETHILGFEADLIGKKIAVDFLEKKRDQIAFPSVEKLHDQILRDIEDAKKWHKKNGTL